MNEFSDSTNRTLIIIVFVLYILYLNFQRNKLLMKYSWAKLNCNPFYLWLYSITDDSESQEIFQKCIQRSAENELFVKHNNHKQQYAEKIDKSIATMAQTNNNNLARVLSEQQNFVDKVDGKFDNVSELIDQQEQIYNTMIDGTDGVAHHVDEIMDKLNNISSSLQSGMQTLKDKL